jgi:hypothetical protein
MVSVFCTSASTMSTSLTFFARNGVAKQWRTSGQHPSEAHQTTFRVYASGRALSAENILMSRSQLN